VQTGYADDPYCPCGVGRQTAFHLFVQCGLLDFARQELVEETGHSDYDRWLIHDGPIAAKWAIKNIGSIEPNWLLHYLRALDRDPTH